jgi:Rha family phage regulatory protein
MNELIQFSGDNTQKMSSKEIAELTGKEHSNVMRDIRNLVEELEKDKNLGGFNFELSFIINELPNGGSKQLPIYQLTKKETLLLVSGYSAILRAKIINRWEELEQPKKLSRREWAMLVIEQEDKIAQLELQVDNMEQVIDCATDWISILKAAQFNLVKETTFNWRTLKAKSYEMNLPPKMVQSPRYAYQLIYHLNVFRACYPKLNFNIKEDTRNKLKALEK